MENNENILITIITIVFNDIDNIENTLKSEINQNFKNYEIIIIDGCSIDGTYQLLNNYKNKINKIISEPDLGIYDAMNKGINEASGEWIIFMNSGDCFYNNEVLNNLSKFLIPENDLVYSDIVYSSGKLFKCDHNKNRIIHQGLIYRKKLHDQYGIYIVGKKVTISDYIFFNTVSELNWKKGDIIIAICDDSGVSSQKSMFYQKMAVDLIFGNRGRLNTAFILFLYPVYKSLKNIVQKWR